jgi:hypothetical protein
VWKRQRQSDRRGAPTAQPGGSRGSAFPDLQQRHSNKVTEPQPIHVCKLTPARPKAGGIKVAADFLPLNTFPSMKSSASTFPGPQLISTVRTVAWSTFNILAMLLRSGDRFTIAHSGRGSPSRPGDGRVASGIFKPQTRGPTHTPSQFESLQARALMSNRLHEIPRAPITI